MDIGGGSGALLASLLRANPRMSGALFDRPAVIDHIIPFFTKGGHYEGLESRVPRDNVISRNFLEKLPQYEVYTMKWCLHDWDDETVVKILKNIREAIIATESNRLIVLESVLSDTRSGRLPVYGDINMMMTVNGQERTEAKWNELAERHSSSRDISDFEANQEADATSYINYIKPIVLAEELKTPNVLSIIDTKDEWFYKIHPERYVPSLNDSDPETGQDWTGRTTAEKGAVLSWTAYQTAGLGANPKY
ncbi:O-methyltransferase [Fusarium sp. NRRL 25303]|nr:O-methyltransferase [Fusarium sp. NRRL 25303]